MAQTPEAPPAPQGPGVVPPFPAPPTEGRRLRVGWGLGVGAAVLLLVCGGGVAAVIGLVEVMSRALNEQAQVVIGDYLDDVNAKRYAEAYDSLCAETKAQVSQAQFTSDQAGQEPIRSYTVGDLPLTSVDLAVPVDVTYTDGSTGQLRAYLGQNRETGQFQVCSVEE
jgi:hypothetical protein